MSTQVLTIDREIRITCIILLMNETGKFPIINNSQRMSKKVARTGIFYKSDFRAHGRLSLFLEEILDFGHQLGIGHLIGRL